MYVPQVIHPRVMASYAWKNVLFFLIYDTATTAIYASGTEWIALPFTPVGTLGMAVAIVVGFHNQSAYERWRTGLDHWRDLVADSATFAASALALLPAAAQPVARQAIRRRAGSLRLLRNRLREEPHTTGLEAWLEPDELAALGPPDTALAQLCLHQIRELQEVHGSGQIDVEVLVRLLDHVSRFQELAWACVSMKDVPLPRQYSFVTRVFVWVFVLLLPMGFMTELGWGTMPLAALLSITFVTLEQVGRFTEDPFDNHMNDVPVDALTRDAERQMLALLDEELPPRAEPVDGVLC